MWNPTLMENYVDIYSLWFGQMFMCVCVCVTVPICSWFQVSVERTNKDAHLDE